jgi:hypothetical protein
MAQRAEAASVLADDELRQRVADWKKPLLCGKLGMSEVDAQAGLEILFAYTEREHPFNEGEVAALLDAIHACKILDPACGSGAFPMGMLHKLVYIIHKLDPDNARWKQLQIDAAAKIPDLSAREAAIGAIEKDFTDNEDDYGRKLYLIENCLYGVDIQPIASRSQNFASSSPSSVTSARTATRRRISGFDRCRTSKPICSRRYFDRFA